MVRMKTIKILELPPSQSQILVLNTLAEEGPTNAYQIAKKTGRSYSLIFKSLKELEKYGMVNLKEKKRTEKETMANIYDLALKGVLFILKQELASFYISKNKLKDQFIDDIIKKYDSLLPLVFGKWSYFDKMSVREMALARLKLTVDSQQRLEPGDPLVPGVTMEQKIRWFFYFMFLYPPRPEFEGSTIMADPKTWINVWQQDQDIKVYVVKELKSYQKRLENLSIFVKKSLSWIEEGIL